MTEDLIAGPLADYRDQAPAAFLPPPLPALATRGRWRTRRRVAAAGAAMAVAAAVVAVIVLVSTAVRPAPQPPAPIADTITTVDWTRAELTLPSDADNDCPRGKVRVYPRDSVYLGHIGQTRRAERDPTPYFAILPGQVYGDLTGDGVPEAVLAIRCVSTVPDGVMPQEGSQLLVVTMRADHSLVGLGFVGIVHALYQSYRVEAEKLYVKLSYDHSTPNSFGSGYDDTGFTQVYQWDGLAFERVAGRASNLNFMGQKDANGSKVQLAAILGGGVVVCPAATVSFSLGEAEADGYTLTQSAFVRPIDLDGDGNDELIAAIRCRGPGYDATSVYVFAQGDTSFVAIDVPFANSGRYDLLDSSMDGDRLVLQFRLRGGVTTQTRYLTWRGDVRHFQPGLGAYRLP